MDGILSLNKSCKIPVEIGLTASQYEVIADIIHYDYPELWWYDAGVYKTLNNAVVEAEICNLS